MKALGNTVQNFELHVSWDVPVKDIISFFDLKPNAKALTLE